jgi:hypothetical protein
MGPIQSFTIIRRDINNFVFIGSVSGVNSTGDNLLPVSLTPELSLYWIFIHFITLTINLAPVTMTPVMTYCQ